MSEWWTYRLTDFLLFSPRTYDRLFELYNASRTKEMIEAHGGKSVTFPELADRVADDLYTRRLSIAAAGQKLPIGNRMELKRWQGEVKKVLEEIVE